MTIIIKNTKKGYYNLQIIPIMKMNHKLVYIFSNVANLYDKHDRKELCIVSNMAFTFLKDILD